MPLTLAVRDGLVQGLSSRRILQTLHLFWIYKPEGWTTILSSVTGIEVIISSFRWDNSTHRSFCLSISATGNSYTWQTIKNAPRVEGRCGLCDVRGELLDGESPLYFV